MSPPITPSGAWLSARVIFMDMDESIGMEVSIESCPSLPGSCAAVATGSKAMKAINNEARNCCSRVAKELNPVVWTNRVNDLIQTPVAKQSYEIRLLEDLFLNMGALFLRLRELGIVGPLIAAQGTKRQLPGWV